MVQPMLIAFLLSLCFFSAPAIAEAKVALKVLPLGASITWGVNSATKNGYRKPLRDQLTSDGWKVDMVGSKQHGSMPDNDVEAHSGDTVDQIKKAAQNSLKYKPNVVLINAGTNDCNQDIDISNTGKRMESLIDSLLKPKGMQNTTIVLSTLIPSHEAKTAANIPKVNPQYRDLVTTLGKKGVHIVLADMDSAQLSWPSDYTTAGKTDATHPNDGGYKKMADVWYKAIQDAWEHDFIPSRV